MGEGLYIFIVVIRAHLSAYECACWQRPLPLMWIWTPGLVSCFQSIDRASSFYCCGGIQKLYLVVWEIQGEREWDLARLFSSPLSSSFQIQIVRFWLCSYLFFLLHMSAYACHAEKSTRNLNLSSPSLSVSQILQVYPPLLPPHHPFILHHLSWICVTV